MAHIITLCKRCGNDFMYHESDYHLHLPVNFDTEGNITGYETVCQDCHFVETKCQNVSMFLFGLPIEQLDYELYVKLVKEAWEEGMINELEESGFLARVDETECCTYRTLTEREFRGRFLNENF